MGFLRIDTFRVNEMLEKVARPAESWSLGQCVAEDRGGFSASAKVVEHLALMIERRRIRGIEFDRLHKPRQRPGDVVAAIHGDPIEQLCLREVLISARLITACLARHGELTMK